MRSMSQKRPTVTERAEPDVVSRLTRFCSVFHRFKILQPDASTLHGWTSGDTFIVCGLLLIASATRFWRLNHPIVIAFDETYTTAQAYCFLNGLPYRVSHPALEALLVALSMSIFGINNSWSWRLPNAIIGTALVGVTYLLGRRLFGSRVAATMAALFVVLDGLFLVDSRLALWEIPYLTFAAWSYLMLFRFAQTGDTRSRRIALAWMGLALGLGLGCKLLIPAIALVLTLAFVALFILQDPTRMSDRATGESPEAYRSAAFARQLVGVIALVGGLSALVYEAVFLPNYWFGGWRGVTDQLAYYAAEFRFQNSLVTKPHHWASPWWSWPLMLRAMLYWNETAFVAGTTSIQTSSIRALGNPVIWWGVLAAVPLMAVQAVSRKDLARGFVVLGYLSYLAMWIPVPRYKFLYYYMPALYFGFLALAAELDECWRGTAHVWEEAALLMSLAPAIILGLGTRLGMGVILALATSYVVLRRWDKRSAGILVCFSFLLAVLALFVYFFPIWTGIPLSPERLQARMWLHGAGLANWN